jgi:AcrR family transcriptional regulator
MGKKNKAAQTREAIFQACSRILRQEGFSHLTLQAVANEAGISKGGLLYHFPNKSSMIRALFEYHNAKFENHLQEILKKEDGTPGAYLRAYAKASIEEATDPDNADLYASLFAAEESYSGAHKLMRDKYDRWQMEVENSGLDPTWATLLRLTVDGFWFALINRYAPPEGEQLKKITEMILALTYQENIP